MKKTLIACVGILLMAGAGWAQPPSASTAIQRSPTIDKQLEAELAPALQEFERAWNAHDSRAMAAVFTPDAVLINPAGRFARGAENIEKLLRSEQQSAMKQSRFSHRIVDVRRLAPGLALVDEEITITGIQLPSGQERPVLQVHAAMLMKKVGDGWKIVDGRPYVFAPMSPQGVGGSGPAGGPQAHCPQMDAPPIIRR